MALTINHQTNDISATSGSVTIDGAALGGLNPIAEIDPIATSQTYSATRTGKAILIAIGAGGCGGAIRNDSADSNDTIVCSGGGSGGFCAKVVELTYGDTLSVTIGADNTTYLSQSGSTTITGTVASGSVNMTATGGFGGLRLDGTSNKTVEGASGGSASGGDINVDGMASGSATETATSGRAASAGGSVRWSPNHPTASESTPTGGGETLATLLPPFLPDLPVWRGEDGEISSTLDAVPASSGGGGGGSARLTGTTDFTGTTDGANGVAYVIYLLGI